MIGVLFGQPSSTAGRLVAAALGRSVSRTQVALAGHGGLDAGYPILAAVDLADSWGDLLVGWLRGGSRKLILFGTVPGVLADSLGWASAEWPVSLREASRSQSAPSRAWRASAATVAYGERAKILGGAKWVRAFERFDFTDEWNNLGFGAIRADGSPWAVSRAMDAGADEIAAVSVDGVRAGSYAALGELDDASVLWFNRPVGPCDSFEWRIVEAFLANHRAETLPCQPVLSEIPWGYDAAITSRLDCDEDVESARPLRDAYLEMNVPFSLAVHTSNLSDPRNIPLLHELLREGGAILSHTATHAPNWGGSYEAALQEGSQSVIRIREATGHHVHYAVSPFHQSPGYALHALADVGYQGCIGGIIRNDPEFNLARGGELAGLPVGFVGHSQQCMLHGECMLAEGDPLAIFKQAFDSARDVGTLFGYLDHPFSTRYAYGWQDEQTRIDTHRALIAYIRQSSERPLFLNEDIAMDFLRAKALTQVVAKDDGYSIAAAPLRVRDLELSVEYKGHRLQVSKELWLS
ncbi:polysaccharide deacetylase [Cupriavidus sp. WKF15]|uniref:polysaccharide deacetylase n=1 Tax=Cupriavidus sp. WKF15 TaxID=3032282 RepID=UPI0023E19C60|nr:polysaccharide deacetylase [Cupriavidus sp. WKF15]WER45191.1 polysaccharide deacetylase [Cupriavidus sp. WKF15]